MLRRIARNRLYYGRQKAISRVRRTLFEPNPDQVYLFILAGPRTASTLLSEIINTSPNVSRNNPIGEGQYLPELKGRYPHRWNPGQDHDWSYIKSVWMKYWDSTKPVLLEKSPPNLKHAAVIETHFDPAYFLCLTRNPYAHCESLIRRTGFSPRKAAEFAIECLSLQRRNLETLRHARLVRFEDLPDAVRDIQEWLPSLVNVRTDGTFTSYNSSGKDLPITNLNAEKISRIPDDALDEINRVFGDYVDVIEYFKYQLIATKRVQAHARIERARRSTSGPRIEDGIAGRTGNRGVRA